MSNSNLFLQMESSWHSAMQLADTELRRPWAIIAQVMEVTIKVHSLTAETFALLQSMLFPVEASLVNHSSSWKQKFMHNFTMNNCKKDCNQSPWVAVL